MNFLILGPLEIRASERPVRIGGLRQRKLLAVLLLSDGHTLAVEQLIDDLWDSPPASVRQQVHNAVGGLRRTLAMVSDDFRIARTSVGYKLDIPDKSVDLHRFRDSIGQAEAAVAGDELASAAQHFRSALAMWRGEPLAGLSSSMITTAAVGLQEERLTAIESLMSLQLRIGESSSIIGELHTLVAANPFRETLRGQLMTALYRSGRQADALTTYDQGRRLLAEELGVDPGPNLRTLHTAILKGTVDAADSNPGRTPSTEIAGRRGVSTSPNVPTSPVPPGPEARCFLPNDIGDFSGRSAELDQLLAQVELQTSSALVISAIDGMGGVGKTTLAVRIAHQLAANYPDGQYFIDLHGFTNGVNPVAATQALESLLQDCGVPAEIIPPSVEGRVAQWRQYTAGKRALVVLDNATNSAHVRSLIPGTSGILVIITSRRKLAVLEGTAPLSLDVFPLEDSIALFTQIVGKKRIAGETAAVATAVELCGHLPLAIRICAARLRERTSWTVANLIERLQDQTRRSRLLAVGDINVMAALKVSYRYLEPQLQRLFRLLSLHPGTDFDAYVAAALAGVSPGDAEVMLESLLDDNLLRQDVADRYYFHDLIRDCARALCDENETQDDQRAALELLFAYYLHSARIWCGHLIGGIYKGDIQLNRVPQHVKTGNSDQDLINNLRLEHANITSIVRFAAGEQWGTYAWQLACVAEPYFRLRNYDGNSRQIFELALDAARADRDPVGEAACLRSLITVCRESGSMDEARQYLDQAILHGRQYPGSGNEPANLLDLGILHFKDENLTDAFTVFKAAYEMLPDAPASHMKAAIVNNLGVVSRDLGHFVESLQYFQMALKMKELRGEAPHDTALTLWNIGVVLCLQEDYGEATGLFGRALDISVEGKFPHGESLALLGLSCVSRLEGDLVGSLERGRRALKLARKWALRKVECEALETLGEVTFLLGDYDRAQQIFDQALEHSQLYEFRRNIAHSFEGFAHLAWARGDLASARKYWEQAIDLYPIGMVGAHYASLHLATLDDCSTICFRCKTTLNYAHPVS